MNIRCISTSTYLYYDIIPPLSLAILFLHKTNRHTPSNTKNTYPHCILTIHPMSHASNQTSRLNESGDQSAMIKQMMNMLTSMLNTSPNHSSSDPIQQLPSTAHTPSSSSKVQVTSSSSSAAAAAAAAATTTTNQDSKSVIPVIPPDDFVAQGFDSPSPITENIYIGGMADARNKTRLFALNIEYVLNLNELSVPCFFPSDFIYKCIQFDKSNPFNDLDEIFTFLDMVINANSRVLVHDESGLFKSPAIILMFLCQRFNFNLDESYRFLKSKRRDIKVPPDLWSLLGMLYLYI